jgi:hypothetical protein
MLTPGERSNVNPLPAKQNSAQAKTQSAPSPIAAHVERHYKSIGIGALASALSVMKRSRPSVAPREWPAFLVKEDIAA